MATALNVPISGPTPHGRVDMLPAELRTRQQCIAEITEMIHVRFFSIFSSYFVHIFFI